MKTIFLSHSFHDDDRALVAQVESLIRSHGLLATNGRVLGGGPLTDEIRRSIEAADALVALLTVRHGDPLNVTHPWVHDELNHARSIDRPAIGVYETGVTAQGMYADRERIALDPAHPVEAFLKLSAVIGEWKRRSGRRIKVKVLPEAVAKNMGTSLHQVRCEYRWYADGEQSSWTESKMVPEVGGLFADFRVPDDVEMVQLRASQLGTRHETDFTPLWIPVNFEPR